MRILHIISGLRTGGAENMLLRLLAAGGDLAGDTRVLCLAEKGPMAARFEAEGIEVRALGAVGMAAMALRIPALRREVRSFAPELVQSWMYHADLAAALTAGGRPLVWNIRHSDLAAGSHKATTRLVARLCARLSWRVPRRILCNSRLGLETHAALGYCREKMRVVPNGFDTQRFRPDPAAGERLRRELGLGPQARLLGYVARIHAQKDHATFLDAAARLSARRDDVHFVLVGRETQPGPSAVEARLRELGLAGRVHLLGEREDLPFLQASWDLATLTARGGEGFPNVLGEAMACGVPCVTTDVGDASQVVGKAGLVAPIGDAGALAAAWQRVLEMAEAERRALGERARQRIEEHFSIGRIAALYREIYREVLEEDG